MPKKNAKKIDAAAENNTLQAAVPNAAPDKAEPASSSSQAPREGSKQALVVELLSRTEGASVAGLMDATGWLPHTTRAALTGLRKRGFAIERATAEEGGSVYRIAAPEPVVAVKPKSRRTSRNGQDQAQAAA